MKKSIFVLVILSILFSFCNTPRKLANKAFHSALLGQNEMTIYSRIGMPTSIEKTFNRGKVLMYEFYSMEKLPANIEPEDYSKSFLSFKNKSGTTYDIPYNPKYNPLSSEYNKRQNTTYQEKVTILMVFLDKQGKCIKIDHNLPKERLEFYYERLKAYIPKD